jgi:hypothetical protein
MTLPKLGRKARGFNPAIPHLSAHLAGRDLPPPPDSVDWTRGLPADLGPMLNNRLNDCSCAAFYHALQVWSFNATGTIETEPDSNVEALYSAVSGYKPGEAAPGPECGMQDVLTHILKSGAPVGPDGKRVNKLAAFLEVDHRHSDDLKRTIQECGVAYIGVDIPAYLHTGPVPAVWDVEHENTKIIGGHAVAAAGYDAQGVQAISGGKIYTLTWAYLGKYTHEAYALADVSWIEAKGTSPAGLTLEQLERQMQALKG